MRALRSRGFFCAPHEGRFRRATCCVLVLLICIGFAPGCARQWAYDRPGVTDADRARDAEECRKANTVPRVPGPLVLSGGRLVRYPFEGLDRHGYDLCMEGKGYRLTPR